MRPSEITYTTDLDREYAKDLCEIGIIPNQASCDRFQEFLYKYEYWLDEKSKSLKGEDFVWLQPLIADCRNDNVVPESKHLPAMALLMPERLLIVSMIKTKFKVPWGCAYIRMREEGKIDF